MSRTSMTCGVGAVVALALISAGCSDPPTHGGPATPTGTYTPPPGAAGTTGAAGSGPAGGGAAGDGAAGTTVTGQAGQGAAGASGDAGTSGAAGTGAAAGTSGAAGTGAAGTGTGAAGTGAAGTGASNLYPPPPRDIMLDLSTRFDTQINFSPTAADPGAKSFHGNNFAIFKNKPTGGVVQKKLVIGLHGVGNGAGPGGALGWAAGRGFHVIGVDYANNTGGTNGDGNGYRETWSGEDVCTCVDVKPVDSVMNRIKSGLKYLQGRDPGADWAYYLNADGSVRWNDVIAFGYSFGGQTVVAGTKYVPLARAIPVSAPGLDVTKAPWLLTMPALTPPSRSYVISGNMDGGHQSHIKCVMDLMWQGPVVNTAMVMPPYMDSHILEVNFGHSEFCSIGQFDAACDYVFGTQKM
jgi:hypothetical protein